MACRATRLPWSTLHDTHPRKQVTYLVIYVYLSPCDALTVKLQIARLQILLNPTLLRRRGADAQSILLFTGGPVYRVMTMGPYMLAQPLYYVGELCFNGKTITH